MSDKKHDKRRYKRYSMNGGRVEGNVLYPSDMKIINMSVDGADIETKRRLELNKEYTLRLKYKDANLDLKGRVMWSILSHTEKKKTGETIPNPCLSVHDYVKVFCVEVKCTQ
jgi:hypothetical protein